MTLGIKRCFFGQFSLILSLHTTCCKIYMLIFHVIIIGMLDKPRQHIKKQRHHSADRGPNSQSYGFPSSHVWMWVLDHKECWVLKNWCLQTVVLEKTPESPLDSKEIKPINLKGNQPWILIGRTDAEVETSVLWSSEANSWLIGKVPDAGKDWGQEEKGEKENEMVGWHHQLNSMGLQRVGHD